MNARIVNAATLRVVASEHFKCTNGVSALIICPTIHDLKITNTVFRKKDIEMYKGIAKGSMCIISYVLDNNENIRKHVQDIHVNKGDDIYSDQYLLIAIVSREELKTPIKSNEEAFKIYLSYRNIRGIVKPQIEKRREEAISKKKKM